MLKISIYDKEVFKNVKLSRETKALLKQKPKGEKLLHLNRLLLEDAYSKALKKHKCIALTEKLKEDYVVGIDIGLNN